MHHSSNGSLIITMKGKTKYRTLVVTTLSYILQTITLTKCTPSGASVAHISDPTWLSFVIFR